MIVDLVRRNTRLFFRRPSAVFFSLLASIILFFLNVGFLLPSSADGLWSELPGTQRTVVSDFVTSWMLGNVTALATMTTSLFALIVFVDDRVTDRFRDIRVTAATRFDIVAGYVVAAFVTSAALSLVVFAMCYAYLGLVVGNWLPVAAVLELTLEILGLCLVFSTIWSFVVTFIRSNAVFMSFGMVIGTASGFFAGAYVLINQLGGGVSSLVKLLPFYQAACVIRGPFTNGALATLADGDASVTATIREDYGLTPVIGSHDVSTGGMWLYFGVVIVVFLTLGTISLDRQID